MRTLGQIIAACVVGSMLVGLTAVGVARDVSTIARSKGPFIASAIVDFDADEIIITGRNLHSDDDPLVSLGGDEIEGPHLFDVVGTQLIVVLPDVDDGTYRLAVKTKVGIDSIDLAVGAVGPVGDPTALIAGPGLLFNPSRTELSVDFGNLTTASGIVIESTANGVQLIAGGSKITLSASGEVTIESADALALKSATRLDLDAPVIDIQATSGLTLKGLTVDVDGAVKTTVKAPLTEVRGSAILDMRGALIKLN